jgi:hypothetical protein
MFEGLIINADTEEQLLGYLRRSDPGSLILSGKKHMGKATAAKRVAEHLLGGRLFPNPDFMAVEPEDGTIHIEQVRCLIEKSRLLPAAAKRQVFLVDDADRMSISAQNALLKLLEDGNDTNIVIFISNGGLLPTICSRCTQVSFLECDMDMQDGVLKLLSNGCPGISAMYKDTVFLAVIKESVTCLNESPGDILKIMHAVKEKDKDFFFDKYTLEEVQLYFKFLREFYKAALLQQLGYSQAGIPVDGVCLRDDMPRICELANLAERQCRMKKYSRNDFLRFLFELALG